MTGQSIGNGAEESVEFRERSFKGADLAVRREKELWSLWMKLSSSHLPDDIETTDVMREDGD